MTRNKQKDKKRKRKALLILLGITIVFLALWAYSNFAINVSRFAQTSPKIENETVKLVLLSDLHDHQFGKNNSQLVALIKKEKPDIVLFCGDMVNSDTKNISRFIEFSKAITANFDTYMVLGNHEAMMPEPILAELKSTLFDIGVKLLNNESVSLTIKDTQVKLYGATLPLYTYSGVEKSGEPVYPMTAEKLDAALGTPNPDEYNILLAHNPLFFPEYAKWGADLTLCGHIHGGLVRIPFVGGVLSPNGELFPKYDAGKFEIGSATMILSRGLAEHIAPLRMFNPPEICVIEIGAD
jgi:predicted MPP superfamily phosphohydrolase